MCWTEFDFDLELVSKLTCFCAGRHDDRARAEMDLFRCSDRVAWFLSVLSNLTWFSDAGRKTLGFSASIEINLVFVCVVEIKLGSSAGDQSFKNEQKRSGLEMPVNADRVVAQCLIS